MGREKLFQRIRRGDLTYPSYITPISKSFLMGLLQRDPDKRLGGGPGSGDEVKSHPFFMSMDWSKLDQRQVAPPFKPVIDGKADVKYFEKEFVHQPVVNSEVGEGGQDNAHFQGFTYAGTGA